MRTSFKFANLNIIKKNMTLSEDLSFILLCIIIISDTAQSTKIPPNFLVLKFCGNAQFPKNFGRFARNSAETMRFQKISTPEN